MNMTLPTPSGILTIFQFVYLFSEFSGILCFLLNLLFIWVLLVSATCWFGCVVILSLYFFAYLPISSLAIGIFKSF